MWPFNRAPEGPPTTEEANATWDAMQAAERAWSAAVDADGDKARQDRPSQTGAEDILRLMRVARAWREMEDARWAWSEVVARAKRWARCEGGR